MSDELLQSDEFFSFLTGKVSTAISRRLQRNLKLAKLNITSEQWTILYHLWQEEGLTQQELANLTFRDKPSITRLINNLEKISLVIRVNDKQDRRSNLIYLTKEGRKLKEEGMKQSTITLNEAVAGLNLEELRAAQHILDKVFQNIK
ncbi:MAG TPA: MarR family transcriptional regulator [Sphingobacterium bovisgrunnientis]|jgi:DNA-binding MarR family transcriptional regulator|uniref:MarR family winged helix-turn-helix transcriptional regulator n=1 Tax=Sphingobacterium cavernae TaxID=2592657 RepID=UPI00122FFAA2|nr:MarR family transcriptional regulator [Sphingobacterium cavernae]HLS38308.1 MarR family transcriptional regulator [Sphingobacterium bovisgrunnientis]